MIRAFQIAAVLYSGLHRPATKRLSSVFCLLTSVFCLLAGCTGPEEEPIWENVKVGDLAPHHRDKPTQSRLLKAMSFDLHIFEIPADNISKLDDISRMLHTRGLRFTNYRAFGANSFSARFGQTQMWNEIQNLLLAADGRKIAKVSLMLFDGQTETIAVTGLSGPRTIFFTAVDGSRQGANVGPGVLGLRIEAGRILGLPGVCNVTAYPAFSRPTSSSIPELTTHAKLREFVFRSAAFGLTMRPDDLVFLGPKEYISDQIALGGLFFSNPQGSLFFNDAERKPPEHKPAVRIFVLVCTRIDY